MEDPSGEPTPIRSIRGGTSVASDLGTVAGGRLVAAVLSLVTVIFTTRLLGPAGYGVVALVNLLVMLVFTVSTSWTGVAARRYGREDLELRGGMQRTTWSRVIIGAPMIIASVAAVFGLKLAGVLPSSVTWGLVAIALGTGLATIVMDHWVCLLETAGRMKVSALSQVLRQAAYVVALLSFVAFGVDVSPTVILALTLGSAVLFVVGVAPLVWTVGVGAPVLDPAMRGRMLRLSYPVIGLMASQYVFSSVDIYVLRIYRGDHDVGVYAAAYQVYTVLSAVAVSATAVLLPLFVSLHLAGRDALIERYLSRTVQQGLLGLGIVAGVAIPFVGPLVPVVFGDEFASSDVPLAILVIGLWFLFAAFLLAPVLTLHEDTRATALVNAVAAVVNVVADVVMIGVFGMGVVAPAIATTAGLAVVFGGFYLRARAKLGVEARISPWVLAPVVGGFVPALLLDGRAAVPVGVGAALVAGAAILRWRSPFDPEDAEMFAKLDVPAAAQRAIARAVAFSATRH